MYYTPYLMHTHLTYCSVQYAARIGGKKILCVDIPSAASVSPTSLEAREEEGASVCAAAPCPPDDTPETGMCPGGGGGCCGGYPDWIVDGAGVDDGGGGGGVGSRF